MERRGSPLARIGAVIALAALVAGVRALPAAAVQPALVLPPERLYAPVDVPIAFVGTDTISGDARELDVTVTEDGCAPAAGNGWSLDGCARVQMAVAHGELAVPLETVLGGVGQPDGIVAGGAIADQSTDGDGTGLVLHLNGTETQLDDALALLTYTPDAGYEYDGSNPEGLELTVVDGTTPADNVTHEVELLVQQVNDAPTLTVPTQAPVAAGGTATLPPMPPLPGLHGDLWVEDADIADGEADDRMLLALIATCGEVTLRGGALTLGTNVEDLLLTQGHPQPAVDAVLAALPLPVTATTYATGGVTDPHTALLAVGDHAEVDYALSQIDFDAPATDGTCELLTVVSDLGGNGLPDEYQGSPTGGRDQPQPGIEVPVVGVDSGVTTFVVGGGLEVGVPSTLSIGEGEVLTIPVTTASATHPAVDIAVTAAGVTATGGGVDYDEPTSPVTLAAGATSVDVPLTTVEDADAEGDETATVSLALQGSPSGVTLANDTVTVTIADDDAPGPDTTDPTVTIEQGAAQADPTSTAPITFDVTFSEPVTGFAASDVDLSASTVGGTPMVSSVDGSGTTYTVEVSGMTTDGDVVAAVDAGSASDAAGNLNDASTSTDDTVAWELVDTTGPTVTVEQATGQTDPDAVAPILFEVEFSEPVTGFGADDVDLGGSTTQGALVVGQVSGSGTSYTIEVTGMASAGQVEATVVVAAATDAAGNPSAASTSVDNRVQFTFGDASAPVATIDEAPGQADPTDLTTITFRLAFTEIVNDLEASDIDLSGSTAGSVSVNQLLPVSNGVWDVQVVGMDTPGDVVLALPAGTVVDLAGNPNGPSTVVDGTVTWEVDPDAPTVTVEQAVDQPDPTTGSEIRFAITFSEPVTAFDGTGIDLWASTAGPGLVGTLTGNGAEYEVVVSGMSQPGTVQVDILAGAAVDASGHVNGASTSVDNVVTWSDDVTVPTVVVDRADGQADPASTAPIRFAATFSEPVTGFDADDVLLDASTAGGALVAAVAPADKADGTAFTITVTGMTTAGDVSLAVVGGAATDAAGNASLASTADDGVVAWLGPVVVTPVDPIVPIDGSTFDPVVDGGYYGDGYDGTSYGGGDGFLARTGLDVAGLLVLGTGVVGLGLGLVLVARRPWGRTG